MQTSINCEFFFFSSQSIYFGVILSCSVPLWFILGSQVLMEMNLSAILEVARYELRFKCCGSKF